MLQRRLIHIGTLVLFCSLLPVITLAGFRDSPPVQPGFSHPKIDDQDTGSGKQLAGEAIGRSSPTVAEIDGNAQNGREIAIGGTDGILYVYRNDGTLLWQKQVAPKCASASYPDGMINTTPAVGELYGDGVPYVIIGYGTNNFYPDCPLGGVAAFNGPEGTLVWDYKHGIQTENLHGTFSSPGLADVDGDGELEIGYGNLERDILVLETDGTKRWRYHNADTVISSPSFTDVDGDNLPDMIIGSDISENTQIDPPTQDGGYVTAFRGYDSERLWRRFFNQVIYSSPVIVDLDGDGNDEVVVGSGCYFERETRGHWIKILDASDGSDIRTLNSDGCINSSPAIADLDGNGKLDIVAVVDGSATSQGTIQAWEYDNPTPKWRTVPGEATQGLNESLLFNDLRSPAIADVDGNGSLEVIGINWNDIVILNGADGRQLTCNGCSDTTASLFTWYPKFSTPAATDIDGDGDIEVLIGGTHQNDRGHGYLYVWTDLRGHINSPSVSGVPPYSTPWPMFLGGPRHTGTMPGRIEANLPNSTFLVTPDSGRITLSVDVDDKSGNITTWEAGSDVAWLRVSPDAGMTPAELDVVIDPASVSTQQTGAFNGTISIESSFGISEVDVRLIVADEIYQVNLPLLVR